MKSGEIKKANQKDVDYLLGTNKISMTDKIANQMAINRAFHNVGKDRKGAKDYVPIMRDSQQMSYFFDMDQHAAFMNEHKEVKINKSENPRKKSKSKNIIFKKNPKR